MKLERQVSSGTRFSWKFSGQCYMVFCLFLRCALTELCSFWYGLKYLFTLHKLVDKVVFDNKTDDVTSGRKNVDPDTQAVTGGSGANRLRMLF